MKNLRWTNIKFMLIASVMFFSGVCYRCSQERTAFSGADKENILLLSSGEEKEDNLSGLASQNEEELLSQEEKIPAASRKQVPLETFGGEEDGLAKETPDTVVSENPLCLVHICGAVNYPGVYPLPEGSRIYQAVELAGGFLPEADQDFLNLAQPIADGMKITVWTKQEAETALAGEEIIFSENGAGQPGNTVRAGSETPLTEKPKVNINTAGKEELMTLRGIGASRAEDIIAYREKHGSFQKIEDIMKVSGIKDAAFEKIKEDITV